MYLKKFKMQNFRNFGTEDNEVEFVNSAGVQKKVDIGHETYPEEVDEQTNC